MADKQINQLVAASTINDDDLFVLQQGGTAKKLTGAKLGDYVYNAAAEKIEEVNEAVAEAQAAVDQLIEDKNEIAEAVASMAQLGTDTSLTTPGMAADAGATGEVRDDVEDLEKTIWDTYDKKTASGSIVTFDDGAANVPLDELTAYIEPVQSGTGDPSPDNVRPISGHTECEVTRTGKNHVYKVEQGSLGTDYKDGIVSGQRCRTNIIGVKPYTKYTLQTDSDKYVYELYYGDPNGENIGHEAINSRKITITTAFNVHYIRFTIRYPDNSNITPDDITVACVTEGESDAIYPIGTTYDIDFPSEAGTVYGGTLTVNQDGTGTLVVDRAIVDLSTLNWSWSNPYLAFKVAITGAAVPPNDAASSVYAIAEKYKSVSYTYGMAVPETGNNVISSKASTTDLYVRTDGTRETTPTGNVVYLLATPITYTLTTDQVRTLLGKNNIWADTGDISLTYSVDPQSQYDDMVAKVDSVQGMIAEIESGTTASRNYSVGERFVFNNQFCKATTAIVSGEAFDTSVSGNCEVITVDDELDSVGAEVNNLNSMMASDFSAEASYLVGDYVKKDGVFYRCVAAHSGAWNADHFEQTTVGVELTKVTETSTDLLNQAPTGVTGNVYMPTITDGAEDLPIISTNVPDGIGYYCYDKALPFTVKNNMFLDNNGAEGVTADYAIFIVDVSEIDTLCLAIYRSAVGYRQFKAFGYNEDETIITTLNTSTNYDHSVIKNYDVTNIHHVKIGWGKNITKAIFAANRRSAVAPSLLKTFKGENTFYSPNRSTNITYRCDTAGYIAKMLTSCVAKVLPDMIADTALSVNDFRIVNNRLYRITSAISAGGTLTPGTNCTATTIGAEITAILNT